MIVAMIQTLCVPRSARSRSFDASFWATILSVLLFKATIYRYLSENQA